MKMECDRIVSSVLTSDLFTSKLSFDSLFKVESTLQKKKKKQREKKKKMELLPFRVVGSALVCIPSEPIRPLVRHHFCVAVPGIHSILQLAPCAWKSMMLSALQVSYADQPTNFVLGDASRNSAKRLLLFHVVERSVRDFEVGNQLYHALRYTFCPTNCDHETIQSMMVAKNDNGFGAASEKIRSYGVNIARDPERQFPAASTSTYDRTDPAVLLREQECTAVNLCDASQDLHFFPYKNHRRCCVGFYRSMMVLTNLKPICPEGHLLVVPRRCDVQSMHHLTQDELADWSVTMAACVRTLKAKCTSQAQPCDGFSVAVQQGAVAGQTVQHLHTHVIVFSEGGVLAGAPETDDESHRIPRTSEAMAAEAEQLAPLFQESLTEFQRDGTKF